MNMKILGIRILQIFSLLILSYGIFYSFFLEEQLASSLASNAKFYRRAYSLSSFWLSLVCFYHLYQQVLKAGQKPNTKPDRQ